MIKTKTINPNFFFEYALENIRLTEERRELLIAISKKIADEYLDRGKVNLNFICTHNSRRSQLAQVWSFFYSEYFQLKNIFTYSGGTEATDFHRNTVKTLQKSGFLFDLIGFSHKNPKYLISFEGTKKTFWDFQKLLMTRTINIHT